MKALKVKLAPTLSAVALVAAVAAPGAGAAMTVYQPVDVLNGSDVYLPMGVAANPTSKDAYVAAGFLGATGMHRLQANGSDTVFGSGGYFGAAINPTNGRVYALSAGSQIETYDPSGNPVGTPFSVDSSNVQIASDSAGNVYVLGSAGVNEYSPAGNLEQSIDCSACPDPASFSSPSAIALDGDGNLYVADTGNNRVVKFASGGGDPTSFSNPSVFSTGASNAVAADTSTNEVFVLGDDGSGFHVSGYDSSGNQIADFGQGMFDNTSVVFGFPPGDQLAVDPSTGRVYVDDLSGSLSVKVWVFAPVFPPDVVTGSGSNLGQITATLNATVNPNGDIVEDCHFEYGLDTSYGQTAPCAADPGFGTDPVDVSADLSGLSSNTTYHFRIVATNNGGTTPGDDQTFTTLIDQATATTGASSGVSRTAATIAGSVNPNNNPVTGCQFEYGTDTSYGTNVPCPTDPGSGSADVGESVSLTGLAPATTYHYRLAATNAGGTNNGADRTFTTLPNAPGATTGASSGIGPITATVAGSVNPQGAATSYHFEYGTTTAYGSSTPAGNAGGASSQAVSTALTGLKPSTAYHYRLIATNAGGTANGTDQTFTTSNRPAGTTVLPGTAPVKAGKAAISLSCQGDPVSQCKGTLTLKARVRVGIRLKLVEIGKADYDLDGKQTKNVAVSLSGPAKQTLAGAKGNKLHAIANASGEIRGLRLEGASAHKKQGKAQTRKRNPVGEKTSR